MFVLEKSWINWSTNSYKKEDRFKNFHNMTRHYLEHMDLLCRKGFYPYAWVEGIEKLDYEGLPPIDAFHSQLKSDSVLYDKDD